MSDEISFHTQFDGHDDGHLLALHQLQAGPDPAAALTIFRYLRDQLSSGEHLDPAVLDIYLLPALERIIESANPSNEVPKAFGFKGGRGGHRRDSNLERDWLLAVHAEIRYREIRQEQDQPGYEKDRGATAEDMAFEEIAEKFRTSESTVRDSHRKHRNSTTENPFGVRDMHTEELRELAL